MRNKKIMIRISDGEMDDIKTRAGNKPLATYCKEILFATQKDTQKQDRDKISNDWFELILLLEESFLDKLAAKTGSRTNYAKWAVFLLQALEGRQEQMNHGDNEFPYSGWRIIPHPETGRIEPYYDGGSRAILVVESPKGKQVRILEGEPFYEEVWKNLSQGKM